MRVATALVSLGISRSDAWQIAGAVRGTQILLMLHPTEKWDKSAARRLSNSLPEGFSVREARFRSANRKDIAARARAATVCGD